MSLTTADLEAIKDLVKDVIEPLENDVKEIYYMLTRLENKVDKGFKRTDKNFAVIARPLGVKLPYTNVN